MIGSSSRPSSLNCSKRSHVAIDIPRRRPSTIKAEARLDFNRGDSARLALSAPSPPRSGNAGSSPVAPAFEIPAGEKRKWPRRPCVFQ
jgi:hypothetical protein